MGYPGTKFHSSALIVSLVLHEIPHLCLEFGLRKDSRSSSRFFTSYNSVISTRLSGTDYMAILTKQDFLDGAAWNHSLNVTQRPAPNYATISALQTNATGKLRRLKPSECLQSYDHDIISNWRHVLLISNVTSSTNYGPTANESAVLDIVIVTSAESPVWFCSFAKSSDCTTATILDNLGWIITGMVASDGTYLESDYWDGDPVTTVQYCLAEAIEPQCEVTFNVFMLLIAVICNALKAAVFILVLFLPGFRPLITVGDAIASFLTQPDVVTTRVGAPAIANDGSWTPLVLSKAWKPQRCHWFCGASLRQWLLGMIS